MDRNAWVIRILCLGLGLTIVPGIRASIFGSDIPGDGVSSCLTLLPSCSSSFIGSVSSTPFGLVTGSLVSGGSTLSLQLGGSPEFLTFSGGTDISGVIGPLGFNPQYTSLGGNNIGMPISGQLLKLLITNTTAFTLAGVSFYLEVPQTVVTSSFPPQPDGLTFGEYCTQLTVSCSTPAQLALIATPTGPAGSVLNPADATPPGSFNNTSTFGDLLRFTNVNLAPGATGTFSFFVTDYKGTRPASTSGSPASGTFNLEVAPVSAVPEPAGLGLAGCGLTLLLLYRRFAV